MTSSSGVTVWKAEVFGVSVADAVAFAKAHPVVSALAAAATVGVAWYMTTPKVYYDFNKICGDFDDKNLDEDPYYFNPDDFDWVPMVEGNWKVIKQELDQYLEQSSLQPYFGGNLMSKKQCWRVLGLKFWGLNHHINQKHFPKTMAILNKVPNLSLVAFSQIEAGTAITPHRGDTNANIRCHMGLVIPGTLPDCGFQVGDDKRSWQEGKILMFCDAHRHTAFNYTDKTRIILQFDVIRPKYQSVRTLVSARILASICTQKILLFFLPGIKGMKLPLRAIYYSLVPFLFIPILTQIGAVRLFRFFLDNSKKSGKGQGENQKKDGEEGK